MARTVWSRDLTRELPKADQADLKQALARLGSRFDEAHPSLSAMGRVRAQLLLERECAPFSFPAHGEKPLATAERKDRFNALLAALGVNNKWLGVLSGYGRKASNERKGMTADCFNACMVALSEVWRTTAESRYLLRCERAGVDLERREHTGQDGELIASWMQPREETDLAVYWPDTHLIAEGWEADGRRTAELMAFVLLDDEEAARGPASELIAATVERAALMGEAVSALASLSPEALGYAVGALRGIQARGNAGDFGEPAGTAALDAAVARARACDLATREGQGNAVPATREIAQQAARLIGAWDETTAKAAAPESEETAPEPKP